MVAGIQLLQPQWGWLFWIVWSIVTGPEQTKKGLEECSFQGLAHCLCWKGSSIWRTGHDHKPHLAYGDTNPLIIPHDLHDLLWLGRCVVLAGSWWCCGKGAKLIWSFLVAWVQDRCTLDNFNCEVNTCGYTISTDVCTYISPWTTR